MATVTITSRQHPLVRRLRALAARPGDDGTLLLDGEHLVAAALAAGVTIDAAAVGATHLDDQSEAGRLAATLAARGVPVTAVADPVLAAASPVRTPSGLVAIAVRAPVPATTVCAGAAPFVLGALGIQDHGNLGALLRVAEAAGVTGALVGQGSAHPFGWKAVRGSMGAVLRLPIATGLAPETVLEAMRAHGLRTIAAVPRDGADPAAVDWTGAAGLLLGGEGPGLAPAVLAACDVRVTVPMAPAVESLNVATAGAVLVYAARGQRT
jgi:TrmH family RNA methyltransferase